MSIEEAVSKIKEIIFYPSESFFTAKGEQIFGKPLLKLNEVLAVVEPLQQRERELQKLIENRTKLPHQRKELASRDWLLKYVQDNENLMEKLEELVK